MRLFDALEGNERIKLTSSFIAFRIPHRRNDFIAKGKEGQPAILIGLPSSLSAIPPSIHLEHISIDHAVNCRISIPGEETKRGVFSIIKFLLNDRPKQELFLRLAYPIVRTLPVRPDQVELDSVMSAVLEMFRSIRRPAKKSVQGLWAELLMIAFSKDPLLLAKAWHKNPDDIYDFSLEDIRVEVKSSIDRSREHFFSYEQLNPSKGIQVIVSSVHVEPRERGAGIYQLLDIIGKRLSNHPELLSKVNLIVVDTLGESWDRAMDLRFDVDQAIANLRYYDSSSIPKIPGPLPSGISQVKFKSDMSFCEPLTAAHYTGYRFFGTLFPLSDSLRQ